MPDIDEINPREAELAHRDPISGAPGAHPVGTGVGATGGALMGLATGAVAGPLGSAVGLVVGAVIGAVAGKSAAEAIEPTDPAAVWRDEQAKTTSDI